MIVPRKRFIESLRGLGYKFDHEAKREFMLTGKSAVHIKLQSPSRNYWMEVIFNRF